MFIDLVDFSTFLSYESQNLPETNAVSRTTVTRQSRHREGRIQNPGSCPSRADPVIEGVQFKGNHLTFALSDGRCVAIHLLSYPKLLDASELQRKNWKLVAGGKGMQWADIGEDISVTGLLAFHEVRCLVDTELA
jgi:hypothetical protein